jgi:hypothetical protein
MTLSVRPLFSYPLPEGEGKEEAASQETCLIFSWGSLARERR